ncbi:hypothetical protein [Streptomyces sp. BBFR102]|uniref:hypothetical protein n=1 Tax=Streptomyces sp. BBFR102 TaxID=3448171 RepID=UPI003F5304E0
MSGLCAPCRVTEHGFCAGNYDVYIGGFGAPAVRGRCACPCPCCSQEVRGVCDRCGEPCTPATAAAHRACVLRLDPTRPTLMEVPR